MTEKMIRDAYCRIRTIDQTIPDDVLDFMKDAALEKLRKHAVMPLCEGNCGINYCDDNGCVERKRVLVEPNDLPEHEA